MKVTITGIPALLADKLNSYGYRSETPNFQSWTVEVTPTVEAIHKFADTLQKCVDWQRSDVYIERYNQNAKARGDDRLLIRTNSKVTMDGIEYDEATLIKKLEPEVGCEVHTLSPNGTQTHHTVFRVTEIIPGGMKCHDGYTRGWATVSRVWVP